MLSPLYVAVEGGPVPLTGREIARGVDADRPSSSFASASHTGPSSLIRRLMPSPHAQSSHVAWQTDR